MWSTMRTKTNDECRSRDTNTLKRLPTDHDEVSEVDDSDGSSDKEIASVAEMSLVEQ